MGKNAYKSSYTKLSFSIWVKHNTLGDKHKHKISTNTKPKLIGAN